MSSIGEDMKNSDLFVLGAGFACLDIIRLSKEKIVMLGGTAANVLSILSLLGMRTEFLIAKYGGQSGERIEREFKSRGVKCISFINTKNPAPKVIEGIESGKHFFSSVCPKCGQNLVRCSLPTLKQVVKIENQYNKSPNVFFFDRISEGIRECAKQNRAGWNVYEPNSCRMYTNLINGIRVANIVKYSEDRISASVTENVIRDIRNTDVVLLIVTMGKGGIKYIYRMKTGEFSDWNYIAAAQVGDVIDSSGSGDWLTALFIYKLLKRYPNYTLHLDKQYIEQILIEAQRYAAQNCFFVGAQGMLREQNIVDKINSEVDGNMQKIYDTPVDWRYDCDYCFNEDIK